MKLLYIVNIFLLIEGSIQATMQENKNIRRRQSFARLITSNITTKSATFF